MTGITTVRFTRTTLTDAHTHTTQVLTNLPSVFHFIAGVLGCVCDQWITVVCVLSTGTLFDLDLWWICVT